MKKIYIMTIIASLFIGSVIESVNAQELYYENSNGVSFTKQEYDKISEFYWEGYQNNLSNEDFNFLKNNGLFENEINSVEIDDNVMSLFSVSEHTTTNKSLKMSTACSSNCLVSISLNWINLPTIRSYDILGIYLENTSAINISDVTIETNNGKSYYNYTNKSTDGIGTSFKLPTNVTYLKIAQTLIVEKKGNIKASYQHAKKNISYANSKKYSFSKSGIGGVFSFNTGIQSYYDCMKGVSVKLV